MRHSNHIRHIITLLILIVSVSAMAQHSRMHVVLLGDSNTWIGGDDCSKGSGWNKWFKDIFAPASCVSYARSGATWTNTSVTKDNLTENIGVLGNDNVIYNQVLRLRKAVADGSQPVADIVIIMAGTNDAWFNAQRPGVFDKSASDAFAVNESLFRSMPANKVLTLAESVRYNTLLIKDIFPEARILLLTPMQATKTSLDNISRAANIIDDCGKMLGADVLRMDKVSCVKRANELKQKRYTRDGVHTNELGAKHNGRLVAEWVSGLLDN